MKLNKSQAIARRNLELGGAVLGVNNCHFTDLDRKRNIWWFDLPVARIAIGQYEWIHFVDAQRRNRSATAPESTDRVPA